MTVVCCVTRTVLQIADTHIFLTFLFISSILAFHSILSPILFVFFFFFLIHWTRPNRSRINGRSEMLSSKSIFDWLCDGFDEIEYSYSSPSCLQFCFHLHLFYIIISHYFLLFRYRNWVNSRMRQSIIRWWRDMWWHWKVDIFQLVALFVKNWNISRTLFE